MPAPPSTRAPAPRHPTRSRSGRARRRDPKRRSWWWRYRRLLFLFGLLMFTAIAGAAWVISKVPLPDEAPQPQNTFVTDSTGKQLAVLRGPEDRVPVALAQVPQVLQDAVVSAEDRKFFQHGGIDPAGILRATWADIRGGGSVQGGSTITQQYVKNTYVGRERTLLRKLREAVIAVKLERKYDKRQILERYLNAIYLGRGAYGVQAAARVYFGVDVSRIDAAQAAYLASLVRNPQATDPATDQAQARARRDGVLLAMQQMGALTPEQRVAAEAQPVQVVPRAERGDRVAMADKGTQYFVEHVRRELLKRFNEDLVLRGGLRVQTTLDPKLQADAYDSIYGYLDRPDDPAGAMVALDRDGNMVAMVGGRDFARSKVNLAVGAEGGGLGRQPGSTFKPMVLAETVRQGYTVESSFLGPAKITLPKADNGNDWTVTNFQDESFSRVNLIDATAHSVNTVYAQLVTSLPDGPARTVDMAHALGIKSPLVPLPSIALGAQEVSVADMADAYLTFANGGVQIDPQVITRVTTGDGTLLYEARPKRTRVLEREQADVVNFCLQQVVKRGTGTGAQIDKPLAGKTGTTEDSGDAWFVGYTPKLTAAVWMGYPDSRQPLLGIHGVRQVSGSMIPATLFQRFMSKATDGVDSGQFADVTDFPGKPLGPRLAFTTTTTSAPRTTSPPTTARPATTVPRPVTTKPPVATTSPPTTAPPPPAPQGAPPAPSPAAGPAP